jgi:hypothetical protein
LIFILHLLQFDTILISLQINGLEIHCYNLLILLIKINCTYAIN